MTIWWTSNALCDRCESRPAAAMFGRRTDAHGAHDWLCDECRLDELDERYDDPAVRQAVVEGIEKDLNETGSMMDKRANEHDRRAMFQKEIYGKLWAYCAKCGLPLCPAQCGNKPKYSGFEPCCRDAEVIYREST